MDITTLGRMISGLPRDVDITTNTLQVLSLKVGSTSPAELTQAMTNLMIAIYTPGQGLPAVNVSVGAKQDILQQKLIAVSTPVREKAGSDPVEVFRPTTGNTSDVVTAEVLAAAAVDTPVGAGGAVGLVSTRGIFVGTVAGASDLGKVLIRVASTDNGVEDGNGDEVYGVLSESSGVFTLNYKKSDGTAYTILASDEAAGIDFYFVEVADLRSFELTRLLTPAIGGVIDHTTFEHTVAERAARIAADSTLQAHINDEAAARLAADSSVQIAYLNPEITARRNADITLQNRIDKAAQDRADADVPVQANIDAEASARIAADSTLQVHINDEIASREAADSSLQAEVDRVELSVGPAMSSTGTWVGFSGTNYMDTAGSVTESAVDLDGALHNDALARAAADVTLQAHIDSEATSRAAADVTLQANLDIEASARLDADVSLMFLGSIESDARLAADSSIQVNLNLETDARLAADSTLQANLDAETTARLNSDSTLLANILNKKVAVIDMVFVAGESITSGDVVYESKSVAGQVLKANASAIATCETIIGVATESKSATQSINIRTYGEATTNTDGINFELGKRVYVSTTAGKGSKFAPSSEFNVVYLLGNATDIGKVSVNPNLEYIVEGSFVTTIPAGGESSIAAGGEAVIAAN